jgi:hypothetical protein
MGVLFKKNVYEEFESHITADRGGENSRGVSTPSVCCAPRLPWRLLKFPWACQPGTTGCSRRTWSLHEPIPRHACVITTCPNAEEAERLAEALVQRRLAACVQMHTIDSVYRWQGRAGAQCRGAVAH